MKKLLVFLLTAALSVSILASCTPKETTEPKDDTKVTDDTKTPDTSKDTDKTDTAAKAKLGFAVLSSAAKSKDVTAEAAGLAQIDSIAAAVVIGSDNKIVKLVIDSVQTKANFDATGAITTPLDTKFKTKTELGEAYGMKKASPIGKEWSEQIAAFTKYATGKTVAEIKGIAVDETGHATAADLKSSVTISITDYVKVVEKAATNATLEVAADNKLGLAISTDIAKSTNAGEADGKVQAYSYYTALTTDATGKITNTIIDASQVNVTFDKTGKITADLKADLKTKDELGDAYGMKKVSSIGKEWNEQAASFAKYVTGKTAAEVTSIAVDEKKHATAEDLKSSVTVTIDVMKDTVLKAVANAK